MFWIGEVPWKASHSDWEIQIKLQERDGTPVNEAVAEYFVSIYYNFY